MKSARTLITICLMLTVATMYPGRSFTQRTGHTLAAATV